MATKASNQNITLHGKPYNPNQGQIPPNQAAARAARAAAPKTGKPRSAGQIAKEAVGGFIRRGLSNLADNMSQPVLEPREPRGKGRSRQREAEPMFTIPQGPSMNLDMLDHGLDFSIHPDPMYRGMGGHRGGGGRGHEEGRVRKVTTRTVTYED